MVGAIGFEPATLGPPDPTHSRKVYGLISNHPFYSLLLFNTLATSD